MNYYGKSGPSMAKFLFLGLLFGGLVGVIAMYLFSPHSGVENRRQIKQKTFELRDKVSDFVTDTLDQAARESAKMKNSVMAKADQIKKSSQEKMVAQIDRATAVLDTAKKELEG